MTRKYIVQRWGGSAPIETHTPQDAGMMVTRLLLDGSIQVTVQIQQKE